MEEETAVAGATDSVTGAFEADRTHSSFQFAVRHVNTQPTLIDLD
jgi:polyisoprenoid-binding protein YceI